MDNDLEPDPFRLAWMLREIQQAREDLDQSEAMVRAAMARLKEKDEK